MRIANRFSAYTGSISARKWCLSFRNLGRAKAAVISGEGDLISYPNNNRVPDSTGIEIQPDTIGLRTLAAEITPTTNNFFATDDEYDLDRPTEGLSSIAEAVEDIRQGKVSFSLADGILLL